MASTTTLMDVNDDCLREVFHHFEVQDLEIVIDVCNRFRALAKERFSKMKSKGYVFGNIYHECSSEGNQLPNTAKFLRDFGEYLEEIFISCEEKDEPNYASKIIELLTRYCGEKLSLLELWHLDINDDIAQKLRAGVQHLQRLHFKKSSLNESFLQQLPSWLSGLEVLHLDDVKAPNPECFVGLRQKFSNLETIILGKVDVNSSDMEIFFKSNPQLESIHLLNCPNLDDDIIKMVAEHVPEISTFGLHLQRSTDHLQENLKRLGQLNRLSSLTIFAKPDGEALLDLRAIGIAEMPLESLRLHHFHIEGGARNFVAEIAKLKNLKDLNLSRIVGLGVIDVVNICANAKELSTLLLAENPYLFHGEDLLEIVRNSEKLEEICYFTRRGDPIMCIEVDTYKQIVDSIQKRGEKKFLELLSNCYCFHSVPQELYDSNKKCFKHIGVTLADLDGGAEEEAVATEEAEAQPESAEEEDVVAAAGEESIVSDTEA